jgi:hypothetical protein
LTAHIYGGGGFFWVQSTAHGMRPFGVSFEYGALPAFNFDAAENAAKVTGRMYFLVAGRPTLAGPGPPCGTCRTATGSRFDVDRKAAALLVVHGCGAAESKCRMAGCGCVSRTYGSTGLIADTFQQYSVGAELGSFSF